MYTCFQLHTACHSYCANLYYHQRVSLSPHFPHHLLSFAFFGGGCWGKKSGEVENMLSTSPVYTQCLWLISHCFASSKIFTFVKKDPCIRRELAYLNASDYHIFKASSRPGDPLEKYFMIQWFHFTETFFFSKFNQNAFYAI